MTEAVHPRFLRPLKAPDENLGEVLRLGPTHPLVLDFGQAAFAAHHRLHDLRHAERRPHERGPRRHALSGDQFVASTHPVTGKPGWWDIVVGPGKPIDTDRYFVICANVLGGCMGTTGPSDIDPATGQPYGLKFPVVTIRDMVRAQAMLLDALGIEQAALRARRLDGRHAGAAMGGRLPRARLLGDADRDRRAPLGTEHRLQRSRPAGDHGRPRLARRRLTALHDVKPSKGLAVARMAAHITYLSEAALQRKFGRTLQNRDALSFGFDADFQIECYLRHQGIDLRRPLRRELVSLHHARDGLFRPRGAITAACSPKPSAARRRASASSRSPATGCSRPSENKRIAHALNAAGANVSFVEIESDRGHDAFLLDEPELFDTHPRLPERRGLRQGRK